MYKRQSSESGEAVFASSNSSIGVFGVSISNRGIVGASIDSFGIYGSSNSDHAIVGKSNASNKAGVYGYSDDAFGQGVFGFSSAGAGVVGRSTSGSALNGFSNDGEGVIGISNNSWGVYGIATDSSGVRGQGGKYGVYGTGASGGVFGKSLTLHGVIGYSSGGTLANEGFDIYASGPARDMGSSSSRRWKSNIENIKDPIGLISKLRGVTYDWDMEHGGGRHDYGFIAEEVGEVLPELVVYEKNGVDAIAMDYTKVPALLVEAFNTMKKEFDAEITQLKNELALTQSRIDQITNQSNN